ncbi:energy-coupling factor transporter transmembrane component T family protein [Mycoplasma procyoni]|uniref:energy-coupling factor transporter transmembrane component T family protein n=1 Tax=Mycoplasma procyoni TaxID=568784 RepID=UPI00197BDCBD|nr:energy-coupling factor transporter transmembrane component T [Mycoplasma procyoni]MBN3535041.1 energy-coupling factor transporter transmembrane protein EcfT [Mycoplasma procyoni]
MNVTIGKYVHKNTFLHRMDARLKLIINILIISMFFIASHLITLSILLLPILIFFVTTTKKPLHLLKMAKMPIFIFIFTSILYGFILSDLSNFEKKEYFLHGLNHEQSYDLISKTLFEFHRGFFNFKYTYLVFNKSLILGLRIYIMLIVTTLLIYSTKPIALTRAIEDLLSPLKLIRVNTGVIAMIISIAIRFIPTLLQEAMRIMKAQASRGVDFKNGKINEKAKSMITLTIPLFVMSFARAEDLANAMEVRGYDPYEKRTKYRSLKFEWFNWLVLGLLVAYVTCVILIENNVIQIPYWWAITAQV